MDDTPLPESPRQPAPEPDATLPGDTAAADPVNARASLPPVRLPVYRPPNRWLRAFLTAFLLIAATAILLWLLIR